MIDIYVSGSLILFAGAGDSPGVQQDVAAAQVPGHRGQSDPSLQTVSETRFW